MFPVHPTVLSHKNLLISRDLIGYAIEKIETELNTNAIFFQGAAGDLSTRFTRNEQTFESAKLLGDKLANGVIKLVDNSKLIDAKNILIKEISTLPPLKKLKTTEELDSIILEAENSLENMRKNKVDSEVERIYITKVQGAIIQKNIVKNFDKLKKEIYGNIIFIGELRIILLNGEFFYSISEKICKNISKKTIFIGYTGGLVGYVPDSESFDDPGYEVLSSIFEKGVDNIIIEKVNLFL